MRWSLLLAAVLAGPALAADAPRPDFADAALRQRAQLDVLEGLIAANMTDQALDVARELRSQGVKDDRLDILQANAMHQRGMDTDALTMLEGVVKRHPRNATGWGALGLIYADAARVDDAVNALQRASRLDKDNPVYLNNLGFILYAKGDYAHAVESYRAAIAADPSDARTRNNLGFALARLEKDTEALEAFRAAGDESDARYNLGVACEMRNDRAGALTNYQAALAARPDHSRAQSALNALLAVETR
jgi:Flp pilus assembly protein TadD